MIDSDSTKLWPYMQRGYVYFLMQEFHKANQNFIRYSKTAEHLYKLSKKYEAQSVSGKPLDVDVLNSLLNVFKRDHSLRIQGLIIMLYDSVKRKSLFEHSRVVEHVLKIYNPKWKVGLFRYSEQTKSLSLSGKYISQIAAQDQSPGLIGNKRKTMIPLLQTLELRSLDLRGSEIYDIEQLSGLQLVRLDIRNTLINRCGHIKKYLPKLLRITVRPQQIPSTDPVWNIKGLKVIIRK